MLRHKPNCDAGVVRRQAAARTTLAAVRWGLSPNKQSKTVAWVITHAFTTVVQRRALSPTLWFTIVELLVAAKALAVITAAH